MKICPDCAEELWELRIVHHTYYKCWKCNILFVERGKGAYFSCRELTSFTELPDNGRLPDICGVCEKDTSCSHYGKAWKGCRTEPLGVGNEDGDAEKVVE